MRLPFSTPEPGAWQVYLCGGLLTFSYGTVFALLADLQHRDDLPTWGLGAIAGASFLSGLVAQLALGRYADGGHVRRLIRFGLLAGGVGMVWFGLASDLASLVAARAVLGFGNGAFMPAARRAATEADPVAGRALGRLMATEAAGFVLGPSASALLSEAFGLRVPFLAPGVLLLVAAVATRRLPRDVAAPARAVRLGALALERRAQGALLLAVSYFWAIGTFDAIWARFLADRGASTTFIGVSLLVVAAPLVLLPAHTGRFAERVGPVRVAVLAQLATSLVLCGYTLGGGLVVACGVALTQALLDALAGPAGQLSMARAVGPVRFGAGQGLYGAVGLGTAGMAAIVSALVYERWGPAATWLVAAIVVAATADLSWRRGARTATPRGNGGNG